MTYDFFADEEDKKALLNYILQETDLHIFDLSSRYGENIREYKTMDDITSCFDLANISMHDIHFQLWSPQFKGKPVFEKISLDPKKCEGHTFRYSTRGWGLIQLYLRGINANYLNYSHIGHFEEKGALNLEGANKTNGKVNAWDWDAVRKISAHLKHLLHKKLAVKKTGRFGVLAGAEKLEQQGIILR